MAGSSLYKLLIEILGRDAGASKTMRGVRNELEGIDSVTGKVTAGLQFLAAAGFAYAAKRAVEAGWEMGKVGAQALRMEESFGKLAQRINTTGDALLASLQKASAGTVSDMELMQTTAGLLASGIQASSQDIVDAMEIARLKAQQFGLTTAEAYNRLLTGTRKFSVEMLDEIGINLKAESVYQRRAAALGVTASMLTDAQKAEALWVAALEDGRKELEQYGGAVDDYATKIEAAEVAVDNLSLALKTKLAPAVAESAGFLTEMLTESEGVIILLQGLKEGIIGVGDFGAANARRATVAMELGAEAAAAYAQQVITTGKVMSSEAFIWFWKQQQHTAVALDDVAQAAEGATRATIGYATAVWTATQAGSKAAAIYEYRREQLIDEETALEKIIKLNETIPDIIAQNARDAQKAWDTSLDVQQKGWDELRSSIEAALSPTQVTALDMGLTAIGEYTEKWDENARRLDAIAARGFGELQAHPDWAGILGIPENVLQAGEEALKSWASQTAGAVRDLTRPDLLNIDAAVAAVEEYFRDMAARELSLDIITQAVIDKGIVGGEDAKKQVAAALGLDSTFIGEETGQQMLVGLQTAIADAAPAGEFAISLQGDIKRNKGALQEAGVIMWSTIELGMKEQMYSTNWPKEIAALVSPYVVQWLQDQGYLD